MQQERTILVTVDDIDGESPASPRYFEYNGTTFEIDLKDEGYLTFKSRFHEFDEALAGIATYLEVARPVQDSHDRVADPAVTLPTGAHVKAHLLDEVARKRSTSKRASSNKRSSSSKTKKASAKKAKATKVTAKVTRSSTIRAWAAAHDVQVGSHGRIPTAVTQAYEAAQAN